MTQQEADEILEFYEKFLLRCTYIFYIAVVKDSKGKFKLQFGINWKYKNRVDFKDIPHKKVFLGDFGNNVIPKNFPLPRDMHRAKQLSTDGSETISSITSTYTLIKSNNKQKKTIKLRQNFTNRYYFHTQKLRNRGWINNFPPVAHQIVTAKQLRATLGAKFNLKNFGDNSFGITNQHLFTYDGASLGDPVKINKTEKGSLFWMCNDTLREVAFIQLNKNINLPQLKIGNPQIGDKVTHNGLANSEDPEDREGEIISVNATIRHTTPSENEGWKIYRKQILTEHITTKGDSGSLLFKPSSDKTKMDEVVGLNFGVTIQRSIDGGTSYKSYTISNDINNIFNHEFALRQEYFLRKEKLGCHDPGDILVTTNLTNKFELV